ncbi:hypothetical protein OIU77_010627 [Salix suchowensis]|uniref:Uncharacterized protein n=1 Tax=Salix suchowensis TaxID=1278906 RepID=A0ABQ9A901_9ROSI|nr:protein NIM1-INTERACTING [Salix suchowensis]KAJ6320007.1 hypothetical protein OIU78_015409 [Salix suchowensis]KAJ6328988.1 hypothetical protein OIU77_010627 [Salix suchowensis]
MKRKCSVEGEGEERDRVADEEEEEKINSFYTLVRNIRDAHDQVLTGSKEKGKGKEVDGKESKPTWTPSFSPEDFAEEDHGQPRGNFAVLPSASSRNIEDQQQPKKDQKRRNQDLDLNLSP